MDTTKIVALSALKSFYESSTDQIDLYGQAALSIMESDKNYRVETIQFGINSHFQIDIPASIVRSITSRLEADNIIDNVTKTPVKKDMKYALTPKGCEKKEAINNAIRDIQRRENALLGKLGAHFNNEYSKEEMTNLLDAFISENNYIAAINLKGEHNENAKIDHEINRQIGEFFISAEESDPEAYEQLKTILLGSVITANLLSKEETKGQLSLRNVDVYLDTNILFSLLNFHDDKTNSGVIKAVELIKNAGGKLKIFPHTKEEMTRFLESYSANITRMAYTNIPVDSVFWRMHHMGLRANSAKSIIINIDEKLSQLGIRLVQTTIEDNDWMPHVRKIRARTDKEYTQITYDAKSVAAIEKIRMKGKTNRFYLLEKCQAFFLTSDIKLARGVAKSSEYKEDKQVPTVLTYEQITAIMWLKNNQDASNSMTRSFLSNAIKSKVMTEELWKQFIVKLEQYKKHSTLLSENIEEVLSMESTQAVLAENKESSIDTVLSDSYMARKIEERNQEKMQLKKLQQKAQAQDSEMQAIQKDLQTQESEINRLKEEQQARDAQIEKSCMNKASKTVAIRCKLMFAVLIALAILMALLSISFIPLESPWQGVTIFMVVAIFAISFQFITEDNISSSLPSFIQGWLGFKVFEHVRNWKQKLLSRQYKNERERISPLLDDERSP